MTKRVPARSIGYAVSHDCGYERTARTRAQAARGLAMHDCDRQRFLAARRARVAARVGDPGVVRDCAHPGRPHRHGTRVAAVMDKCSCPPCRAARRAYANGRTKRLNLVAAGVADPVTVPCADAMSVVEQLRGVGWSSHRIAAVSGIGTDRLTRMSGGSPRPYRFVRYDTYSRLVALLDLPVSVADGALVDAGETWRLIGGLMALGYPKSWIARESGMGRCIQIGEFTVTAKNARKVAELAARTYLAGPSDRARAYAASRGWTAELLFDDALDVAA